MLPVVVESQPRTMSRSIVTAAAGGLLVFVGIVALATNGTSPTPDSNLAAPSMLATPTANTTIAGDHYNIAKNMDYDGDDKVDFKELKRYMHQIKKDHPEWFQPNGGLIDQSYQRMVKACDGVGAEGRRLLNTPVADEPSDPTAPPNKLLLPYIQTATIGDSTFNYYSNVDLEKGGNYKMAMLVFHGATRDAHSYFCTGVATMNYQDEYATSDIAIIAPDFNYKNDWMIKTYAQEHDQNGTALYWSHSLDYRTGSRSSAKYPSGAKNREPVSSFAVIDHLVGLLNSTAAFPNLGMISVVGHSAGGQVVQRYAMATHIQPAPYSQPGEKSVKLSIDLRFVIANPSSWAYLDDRRWAYNCSKSAQTCSSGYLKIPTPDNARYSTASKDGKFYTTLDNGLGVTDDNGAPHTAQVEINPKGEFWCWDPDYNKWHYGIGSGFDDGNHEYLMDTNWERNVDNYALRNVVYLAGMLDMCSPAVPWYNETGMIGSDALQQYSSACDFHHLDTRCPAMLEGPWREYRALHYMVYLEKFYGESVHKLVQLTVQQDLGLVPDVGHNGLGMLTSEEATVATYSPVAQGTVSQWTKE